MYMVPTAKTPTQAAMRIVRKRRRMSPVPFASSRKVVFKEPGTVGPSYENEEPQWFPVASLLNLASLVRAMEPLVS